MDLWEFYSPFFTIYFYINLVFWDVSFFYVLMESFTFGLVIVKILYVYVPLDFRTLFSFAKNINWSKLISFFVLKDH